MKAPISKPVNAIQRDFNALCEKGGGLEGGPARRKVLELLRDVGKRMSDLGFREAKEHLDALPDANPWHVCFALGLWWGHLAKLDIGFTEACVRVLANWNDRDLRLAESYHMERGPESIHKSLEGAYILFEKVRLPDKLPTTLDQLQRAQERWLSPIINPATRPPYIGAWNATAMFMMALCAQPQLAATHLEPPPVLPPAGPVSAGLSLLHRGGVLSRPPQGSELDDEAFEPGALYENNVLLAELRRQLPDWSMIDVHCGVYMLGTRHPHSDTWG